MASALTLVLFSLSGCGDGEDDAAPDSAASETPEPATVTEPKGPEWRSLARDNLHDPANPVLDYLQEPAVALETLPRDGPEGNKADWMAALEQGAIKPRTNLYESTEVRTLDKDIVFTDTAGQPNVVFPHRQHTAWLDCSNCHSDIFVARKGANDFGMLDVLNGEYCGRCHGAVSFPLTQCARCHSGSPGKEAAE